MSCVCAKCGFLVYRERVPYCEDKREYLADIPMVDVKSCKYYTGDERL